MCRHYAGICIYHTDVDGSDAYSHGPFAHTTHDTAAFRSMHRRVIGTKKQAEKVQKKLEAEIVEGVWDVRNTEDIPFSQLVDVYLEYAKTNKAKSTYSINKYRIEAHLLSYFGHIPLNLKWSDIDFDQLVVVIQAKKDWHTKK